MNLPENKLASFEKMIPYINHYEWNHLTPVSKTNISENTIFCKNKNDAKTMTEKQYDNLFFIHSKHTNDRLFWMFYIMKYGFDIFEIHKYKLETEYTEKYANIDNLKIKRKENKYRDVFKQHKLNIDDIINDIGSQKTISISSFVALCILNEIPITILTEYTYITINQTESTNNLTYVLKLSKKDLFKNIDSDMIYKQPHAQMHYTKINITEFHKTHIETVSLYKILKSTSAYKVYELQLLMKVLQLDTYCENGKSMKKNELYNKLHSHLYT